MPRNKHHKYSVEYRQGVLYLRTNQGAKNFRLTNTDWNAPAPDLADWTELVAHRADTLLDEFQVFSDYCVCVEEQAGLARFLVMSFASGQWKEIIFPEPAYLAYAGYTPVFYSCNWRYVYQSMITPVFTGLDFYADSEPWYVNPAQEENLPRIRSRTASKE